MTILSRTKLLNALYKEFMDMHRDHVKEFGFMSKPKDSEALLRKYPDLVCDHTASYLVVWCIDLQVEGKTGLMGQVAHQTISMQFILELAKGLNKHPADCFPAFYKVVFKKMEVGLPRTRQYSGPGDNFFEFSIFPRKCPKRTKFRQKKALKSEVNDCPMLAP